MTEQTPQPPAQRVPDGPPGPAATKPADLVLEGGGVKGIGLVGAVLTLTDAGYRFPRVAGTSAGAIAAALIAALDTAGQPLTRLKDELEAVDYQKFMAESRVREVLGRVGDASHLLMHQGLYDGDYLVDWLGGLLRDIGVTKFGDLKMVDTEADRNLRPEQRYRLVVHTADISRGKCVRLPWDFPLYGMNPDDELIVDAVRASMSIPFFFEPVRRDAVAAVVDGVSYPDGRVTWVDGGLLDNYPVDVFDRTDGAPARWPTIGVKLSAKQTSMPVGANPDNLLEQGLDCLKTVLDNANRYYVPPDKASRTVFVDNAGIKATDFGLTPQQRTTLFENGVKAAQAFLDAGAQRPVATVALDPATATT